MKLTLGWLKEHLDTEAGLDAIVAGLTAVGLEVEGVTNPAEKLAPFRIAEILTAERHPQADKLQVLSVDAGTGEAIQVVCGAPNARAGMKGVFGAPGAYVPGSDLTLKVAAIRGVESRGMMCSVRELELGDEHDGIIELAADAPVGASFPHWAGYDDPVIDLSITPNRGDAMGVHGIARDLAAAGLGRLKPVEVPEIAGLYPCPVEIRSDDSAGCPAFYGRLVRNVKNGPSPDWLRRRLEAVGQRSISTLVDITNYVMLSYGRPLHVYDADRLSGALVARKAREGEELLALDGRSYPLDPSMTVIADEAAVHDIGGIMGGEHSGVTAATRNVLIECAWFDPETISRTGQKLGLVSDARMRFERGVDPDFLDAGLAIATRLVVELGGGEPSEVVRAGEPPRERSTVTYRPARARELGGIEISPARQREILENLGFEVEEGEPEWRVTAPSWRRDVDGSADIVEEVARIEGFDRVVPEPLPRTPGVARPTATREQMLERRVRRAAAARGLNEAVTWSFISEAEAEAVGGGAWRLDNPISEEMRVMRPSLLPGLLSACRRNVARGAESLRLFEIGRRYLGEGERTTLGLVLAGPNGARHWRTGKPVAFGAFDAKAEAMALLRAAGVEADRLQVLSPASAAYHPGRSGRLCMGPKLVLAEFGELHPTLLRSFDLESVPVAAAELYLDAIPARRATGRMRSAFAPPALQPVRRDFAFLLPADSPADALVRAVAGADRDRIENVALFDLFTGPGVPEGEKSIAIEVTLQPKERSFTDEELQEIGAKVVAAAAKAGARLRE